VGEGRGIVGRDEILRRQQFRNTPNGRADGGQSSGHGFEQRPRQAFLSRRQHEQVGAIEFPADSLPEREVAAKSDQIFNVEPPGSGL
jgi:hypothetical protein